MSTGALVVGAVPSFAVAIFLISVFGVELKLMPIDSTAVSYGSGWTKAKAYILPTIALAFTVAPYISRMVRAAVQETMLAPFVRAANLRGISGAALIWRHVMPVALGQIVAVVTLNFADLILGLVVIEFMFGFPGLGQLLVDGVGSGDVPLVQAIVLLAGTVYVAMSLTSEAVASRLDPRIGQHR